MQKYMCYFLAIWFVMLSCSEPPVGGEDPTPPPPVVPPPTDLVKPDIHAKLVFHNYFSYGDGSSRLFIYDFTTNELECISDKWKSRIKDPMNGMLSKDGREVVFMGVRLDGTQMTGRNTWCLFRYKLGSSAYPTAICPTVDRDEDPKFSVDGTRIVFKRNIGGTADVWELDMTANPVTARQITHAAKNTEYSMPYYSSDMKYVVVSTTTPYNHFGIIERVDLQTGEVHTLYRGANMNLYYPIGIDAESFYYSSAYSATNKHDQILRGYYSGDKAVPMPFNASNVNNSDACPVDDDWVIVSSTLPGGVGGYDLRVCHTKYNVTYSLNEYNTGINTSGQELGSTLFFLD